MRYQFMYAAATICQTRQRRLCRAAAFQDPRLTMTGASRFLVFSDDLDLARQRLGHWDDAVFVNGGSRDGDFRLMAACRHHIIANSTFSWWGAWIGQSGGTVTIAPKQWFAAQTQSVTDTRDLFPSAWIQL